MMPPPPARSAPPALDRDALRRDLERRFRTTTRTVQIGGRDVDLLSPANADDLISEDDYVKDERLPYWADLWPSAQMLAREVRTMRLAGQRVLELGCGLGLVAIAAAMAGADVTATDYYDDAVLFASLNVAEATGKTITARMVDWTAMPPDLGRFDVVLTSDVLYEPRYAALVAGAITTTLVRGGEAIVADPGRIACGDFLNECGARGLVVSAADRHAYAEGAIKQTITLYRLRWGTE
jgi:predicted nicotinamide N-methyase